MDLDEWRSRINDLDSRILDLLNQRAEAALGIGELKRQKGAEYFVPEGEFEILARLQRLNPGPFPAEGILAVWHNAIVRCHDEPRCGLRDMGHLLERHIVEPLGRRIGASHGNATVAVAAHRHRTDHLVAHASVHICVDEVERG